MLVVTCVVVCSDCEDGGFSGWCFRGMDSFGCAELALLSWEVWLLAVTCGVVCSDSEEALGAPNLHCVALFSWEV